MPLNPLIKDKSFDKTNKKPSSCICRGSSGDNSKYLEFFTVFIHQKNIDKTSKLNNQLYLFFQLKFRLEDVFKGNYNLYYLIKNANIPNELHL